MAAALNTVTIKFNIHTIVIFLIQLYNILCIPIYHQFQNHNLQSVIRSVLAPIQKLKSLLHVHPDWAILCEGIFTLFAVYVQHMHWETLPRTSPFSEKGPKSQRQTNPQLLHKDMNKVGPRHTTERLISLWRVQCMSICYPNLHICKFFDGRTNPTKGVF